MTNEDAFQKWWMRPGPAFKDEEDIARAAWDESRGHALEEAACLCLAPSGRDVGMTGANCAAVIRELRDEIYWDAGRRSAEEPRKEPGFEAEAPE